MNGIIVYAPPGTGKTTLLRAVVDAGGYAVDTDVIIRANFPTEWDAKVWRTDQTWWSRMLPVVVPICIDHLRRGALFVTNGHTFYRACRPHAAVGYICVPADFAAQADRIMARGYSTDSREQVVERLGQAVCRTVAMSLEFPGDGLSIVRRYLADALPFLIPS